VVGGVLKLRGRRCASPTCGASRPAATARPGPLRLRLDPSSKGKLVLGETALLFQFAPPAPPVRKDPFPQEYAARVFAGFTRFDLATLLSGLMILGPYFIWAATKPIDPTIEHEIDERFLRVMGIPPKKDKVEPEKPPEEDETLLAQEDEKKKKDPVLVDKVISPTKAFSKEAIAKARGVGVARVLGTYGGPGEGTVFDVIQSTENNLGELFAAGMTRVVDADGNEVSGFVPGGEGISALGAAVGTKGFDVSADGPEVAGAGEEGAKDLPQGRAGRHRWRRRQEGRPGDHPQPHERAPELLREGPARQHRPQRQDRLHHHHLGDGHRDQCSGPGRLAPGRRASRAAPSPSSRAGDSPPPRAPKLPRT
jgi:hypothetical protein